MSWTFEQDGQQIDVIDGHLDEDELLAFDSYRSAILAPWVNRIADANWIDDAGANHDVSEFAGSQGLHGLVAGAKFDVEQLLDGIAFNTRIEPSKAYPGRLEIKVCYRLAARTLNLEIVAKNIGDTRVPVALGWHPYFRVASLNAARLEIAAKTKIVTDEKLIPLAGADAFARLEQLTLNLDDDYGVTDLQPEPKSSGSKICAILQTGLGYALTISADQASMRYGTFHIYTGGALERGKGKSVAVEPTTAMANVFNREEATAIALAPGENTTLAIQVTVNNR